ncbi:DUF4249 family protein [Aggregatimonas sangjinii]|uniref:DUF4249 family protein n=1 Tax=Aggregatimonas sangjinii TaxID=2583587 RepID=A0A5B7STI7_9FLAO|nr:DUF4249 family protein [Aggregatimonas sangjinii]QCX00298.1 DUF4249 family protein [Aggregatimonas sangjinii]
MRKLCFMILAVGVLLGCEDVIDVDVPIDDPRLTIDALFRIDAAQSLQTVRVNAGITSGFFDELQAADLEEIALINLDYEPTDANDSSILQLSEVAPGVYEGTKNTVFFSEGELRLFIRHQGQRYLASTAFVPTTDIDELVQGEDNLFGGDETEIIVSFIDTPDRMDYYLFDLDFNEYLVTEDVFYPGQRFEFSYFYDDAVTPGMDLDISILGVDMQFYNYMNQVIAQADGGSAGPFQTPSATVRGNIINVTDANIATIEDAAAVENIGSLEGIDSTDNFALGYFAISQTFTRSITVE